jgi:hypothetical protein
MNLKFKNTTDNRWVCHISLEPKLEDEFKHWLEENLKGRYMLSFLYHMSKDEQRMVGYELRGGDVKDKLLVALRWS